uniref:Uncharacterized protein n=1 Tax=Timema tahoe TaxID=61484 RepID=A0A7R9FIZ2_9NEOP|nr:unnamed protein product [Timema tahoe]
MLQEGHTMAERDLGSTLLMPQTHLYKPDRISRRDPRNFVLLRRSSGTVREIFTSASPDSPLPPSYLQYSEQFLLREPPLLSKERNCSPSVLQVCRLDRVRVCSYHVQDALRRGNKTETSDVQRFKRPASADILSVF